MKSMYPLKGVNHSSYILHDKGYTLYILYRINDNIVKWIYTGAYRDYMYCNGMNPQTYYIKESVECERSLKYIFRKELGKG